ncbi:MULTISPECIES: nucleotidyltransferase family protein [unclassified Oleiphilus]|uniref:nucleotidyltransferase family protein n=1 Tax=unclassified Oleiphilus TaxID=2631174 RepID=UPI000A9E6765|nr:MULTISPECIES: nucleotidyltransferase domain-containing protein [unclassified Oleiphilus]
MRPTFKGQPFGLSPDYVQVIAGIVYAVPSVEKAVIFGSRVKGNFHKGSDVDIALYGDLDYSTVSHIQYQLNEETKIPLFFDVVAYSLLENDALKEHIDRVGQLVPGQNS